MANGSLASYRSSLAELASAGIRSRTVAGVNGLAVHLLEAGRQSEGRPLLLLLHGFPELGYSWRKVMPALADAGYYVVAPDQRGYGATTGWDASFDGDLAPFRTFNLVRDVLGIVAALGYERVHAVIGHDAGAGVAGWCSLLRPDIFSAVAMMSAPFSGPPQRRPVPDGRPPMAEFDARLGALEPPRKHYQWYYSSRRANADMMECPRGLHVFLRGYYHYKSADWPGNRPYRLRGWTATELAKLPTYYVMNRGDTMPEAVAPFTPSPKAAAACRWLPDEDLAVYCSAYAATGFQGGLQWYRCGTARVGAEEQQIFAGRTIDVPSCFISGAADWGVFQSPGAYERMRDEVCTRMLGSHLLPGAGHWVQQEQPERVAELLLEFLRAAAGA
jgi:pimeloyl-ACP methyl ester carboxylesterase